MSHFQRLCSVGPRPHPVDRLEPEQLLRVPVKQLSFNPLARRETAHGGEGLGALTLYAGTHEVVAIAAVDQLVLMALKKSGSKRFVARQGIQSRSGGEIAEHVWVIGEVTLGQSAEP